MSLRRLLLRRIALGVVAVWAVLTLIFALFTVTEDYVLGRILASASRQRVDADQIESIREEYLARRGLDRPLHEQYVDWLSSMATLQWGESFRTGEAVFPLVTDAAVRTARYVLPALVLATLVGLGVGLLAATGRGSLPSDATRVGAYLSFGLPNFWLGAVLLAVGGLGVAFRWGQFFQEITARQLPARYEYVLPVVLVATTLLAAMASYARAYALQYYAGDATKLVRAKGGGRRDVARHALRNAAIPLVSLAFAETLALLALSVIVVEAVFGIRGLGALFYNAVYYRDLPVLMGATLVVVTVGVAGNVVQDLLYSALDPRVDVGSR